jgi:hypothetical protein
LYGWKEVQPSIIFTLSKVQIHQRALNNIIDANEDQEANTNLEYTLTIFK